MKPIPRRELHDLFDTVADPIKLLADAHEVEWDVTATTLYNGNTPDRVATGMHIAITVGCGLAMPRYDDDAVIVLDSRLLAAVRAKAGDSDAPLKVLIDPITGRLTVLEHQITRPADFTE